MSQSARNPFLAAVSTLLLSGLILLPAHSADAQQDLKENIATALELVRGGMRDVLEEEMMLTDEEWAAFWPVYDKYDAERREIGVRYVRLVGAYLDRYSAGTLTNEDADLILDVYFDIEMDTLQLRQRYVRRFRRIMPGIKVARFFQLENQVRAEVDSALAMAIPLADPR